MKTVRFSKVIETCGKPEIYLLLIQPAKDKTLQAAIKSDRVMTVYQEAGSTDYGSVGFEEGRSRQFWLFPKPLKPFLEQRIVGIKYELLEDEPVAKQEPVAKELSVEPVDVKVDPKPKAAADQKSKKKAPETPVVLPKSGEADLTEIKPAKPEIKASEVTARAVEDKVIKFEEPKAVPQAPAENQEIAELKRRIREAMDALEQGKQIVAFNLLKRIVDDHGG